MPPTSPTLDCQAGVKVYVLFADSHYYDHPIIADGICPVVHTVSGEQMYLSLFFQHNFHFSELLDEKSPVFFSVCCQVSFWFIILTKKLHSVKYNKTQMVCILFYFVLYLVHLVDLYTECKKIHCINSTKLTDAIQFLAVLSYSRSFHMSLSCNI